MVILGGSSSSVSVEAATMQAETMQVETSTATESWVFRRPPTELPTSNGKNYSTKVSETIFSRQN